MKKNIALCWNGLVTTCSSDPASIQGVTLIRTFFKRVIRTLCIGPWAKQCTLSRLDWDLHVGNIGKSQEYNFLKRNNASIELAVFRTLFPLHLRGGWVGVGVVWLWSPKWSASVKSCASEKRNLHGVVFVGVSSRIRITRDAAPSWKIPIFARWKKHEVPLRWNTVLLDGTPMFLVVSLVKQNFPLFHRIGSRVSLYRTNSKIPRSQSEETP